MQKDQSCGPAVGSPRARACWPGGLLGRPSPTALPEAAAAAGASGKPGGKESAAALDNPIERPFPNRPPVALKNAGWRGLGWSGGTQGQPPRTLGVRHHPQTHTHRQMQGGRAVHREGWARGARTRTGSRPRISHPAAGQSCHTQESKGGTRVAKNQGREALKQQTVPRETRCCLATPAQSRPAAAP